MRFRLLLVLLLLGSGGLRSVEARQPSAERSKYWIFFTDKRDAAGKTAAVEADHLTPRALERRARRGAGMRSTLDAPLSAAYLDALAARGITPLVRSRWLNAVSVRLDPGQVTVVRALPFVRNVRPVMSAAPLPEPSAGSPPPVLAPGKTGNLDFGLSQTQLELINAIPPLDAGINGTGVRIGFLDTEFGDFSHPAFAHIVSSGRLIGTVNFTGLSQSSRHGLQVASVAVGFVEGELVGPAHGAEVLAATTEYAPTETNQEEDNLVAGLEWMEANGADVVNISLGYNLFDSGQRSYTKEDLDGDTAVTTRAADLAAQLGVVVVTSAGNEGANSWGLITTPADGDSVIAVASVNAAGVRAASSGTGPTADGRIKPDVAAMGVSVRMASPSGGYTFGNGTSFSSPLTAAVAAQMLQANPDLSPIEVRDILQATASRAADPDTFIGYGIIDAAAAVDEAIRCAAPGVACASPRATSTDDQPVPDATFRVLPPYPNPFSSETVLVVEAPASAGPIRVRLFNLLGQEVAVPFSGRLVPGTNRLTLRADGLPAGVYLYRIDGTTTPTGGTLVRIE